MTGRRGSEVYSIDQVYQINSNQDEMSGHLVASLASLILDLRNDDVLDGGYEGQVTDGENFYSTPQTCITAVLHQER